MPARRVRPAGLVELLTALHRRELSLVEVETATASPFASSLLFDYVATYMYEGDTPNAERRAAALSLDRDLLRELLGQEELRDLIDPGALEQVEDDLQCRSEKRRATSRDGLHDMLRALGDLTRCRGAARVLEGLDADAMLEELRRERRAVVVRLAGEERWIDAADAGLYRDALGAAPPGGLPEAFLEDVPDALLAPRAAVRRDPRTVHDRRAARALRRRLWRGAGARSSATVSSSAASCDPAAASASGATRGAAAAAARLARGAAQGGRAGRPARARALPAGLAGSRPPPADGRRRRPLREVLVPLQGLALPVEVWEREVLPRRVGAYSPAWIDQLCASGELVWIGAGALGRSSGRVALYFREDLPLLGPPPSGARRRSDEPAHEAVRERLAAGACFFADLLVDVDLGARGAAGGAVGPRLGRRGDQRRVRAAARAAADAGAGAARARRGAGASAAVRRTPAGRGRIAAQVQGRWSLTAPLFGAAAIRSARRRALAELLLERYGILTREQVLAEGVPGGFSAIYPELTQLETLGIARRGYFVEGLGGAQFALPGAVERLRERERGRRAADRAGGRRPGAAVRRRAAVAGARAGRTTRAAGARGRRPRRARRRRAGPLRRARRPRAADARRARTTRGSSRRSRRSSSTSAAGRIKRLALEKVDGEPALGSALGAALVALGFQAGPAPADAQRLTAAADVPEGDTILGRRTGCARCSTGRVPDEIETPHPRHALDRWPRAAGGPRGAQRRHARQAPVRACSRGSWCCTRTSG